MSARVAALTLLALFAFAGNSLLCRAALAKTHLDPATFTSVRLLSGALVLWLLAALSKRGKGQGGNWLSALALFAYAACFSFAYVRLTAAAGALLLFGAVQTTMIGYGLSRGERLGPKSIAGMVLAFGGLAGLFLPGITAPPLAGSLLMLVAGIAWGIYSLRGKTASHPLQVTAGNFLRASLLGMGLILVFASRLSWDAKGIGYAILSGALASGLGYAIWYTALPALKATTAATVQLAVPVVATFGGILLLGERVSFRLAIASAAILGGIALVVLAGSRRERPSGKAAGR